MVKFVSHQEWYDWYVANLAELLAFKEAHDSSQGLGSYFYSSDRVGLNPLTPINKIYYREKHRYWSQFSDDYPANQKEDVFQEDEIYIVTNDHFEDRENKWWVIYIPIPPYKVNNSVSNPFQKEAWWCNNLISQKVSVTPDLEWISGFIKYEGEPPYRGARFLNYPEGGI
jgi:hypothetical protein